MTQELMTADLQRSGISADAAKAAGFTLLTADDIKRRFGVDARAPGYVIPYRDLVGQPLLDAEDRQPVERVRLLHDSANAPAGDKKLQRYVSRRGSAWAAYLPTGLADLLADASPAKLLVVTEGEKKAFAGVRAGIPCVALPGVNMWHNPATPRAEGEKLNPASAIETTLYNVCQRAAALGWRILVLADSDADTNKNVSHAMRGLAQALRHQVGYSVAYAACPGGPVGEKWGLDDWIVAEGADAVLRGLQAMSLEPVPMPRRVQIPSDSVPDFRAIAHLQHKNLPEREPAWLILANMLLVKGISADKLQDAWEAWYQKQHEYPHAAQSAAIRYAKAVQRHNGALHAYISWPVAGRAERSLWHVETWKDGQVQTKILDASPAAWYSDLVSLVESTDHLLPPEKRPLRLEAEMVGQTDTGETRRVLIPNDFISDKKAWRLAGFDGVSDAGLLEWQKLMAVGKSLLKQRLGVTDKGWITLPDGKGEVYVYGQQVVPFCGKTLDVAAHDGTGAAAQLASGVRAGGSAEAQCDYLRELFRASPAIAGICGFAAAAPAAQFIPQHETGILHIFGTSSAGKTTTLQVVASLMGIGASTGNPDSQIMSWRTTDNGLESPAEARRGSALLIDELHMIPDLKMLAGALYMLANGEGKSRMKADTTMRLRKSWKTQVISTGERSVEFALASADPRRGGLQSVPGGLMFRVIDLAAARAELMPNAELVPGLLARYGHPEDAGRPEAVAHALEKAVQTDFGHIWPELVRIIHERRAALPGLYAQAVQMIKGNPGYKPGNIIGRRVKHAAGALVGLMLLLDVVGADSAQQAIILPQALDWLTTVLLPAGAEDLASGRAESDLQYHRWAEALVRNLGRLDPLAPNSLGWRRGEEGDEAHPREICLHSSAVAELAALAGVEVKIVEDELRNRYPAGTVTRRASKASPGRKVWILAASDFSLATEDADGDENGAAASAY